MKDLPAIISRFGSRALIIVTAADYELYYQHLEQISSQLKQASIGCIVYDELPQAPNTEDIDVAISFIKKSNCDCIIGFGGVESINAAKAISLLASNYVFCNELFSNPRLNNRPLPFISIPGYPLFGFEIMPLFYLKEIHELNQQTYYNLALYPVATIVDPILSLTVDNEKIMKSAVCSLAISTESVISKSNNDIINTYALKSIDLIFRNLHAVYKEPDNVTPRISLSSASVMAGITFSISFLSVTMAIALSMNSKTDLDIESAMSLILPHIMEFNLTASPGKYVQMSKVMGEDVKDITVIEAAIKVVEAIRKLLIDIDIPMRLSNYNISKAKFKPIAELAVQYPFLKNTPRELNTREIETILIAAY